MQLFQRQREASAFGELGIAFFRSRFQFLFGYCLILRHAELFVQRARFFNRLLDEFFFLLCHLYLHLKFRFTLYTFVEGGFGRLYLEPLSKWLCYNQ